MKVGKKRKKAKSGRPSETRSAAAGRNRNPARKRPSRMGTERGLGRARVRQSPARWAIWAVVALALVAGGIYGCQRLTDKPEEVAAMTYQVEIETSKGILTMEIYGKLMPKTVANFVELARSGFYDGLTWHRVEDWVVQTGDPTGTGSGGSDKRIKLEISPELGNLRGAVGMARSDDRDSASSQFYILRSDAVGLDGDYAVFGRVTEGMDVVDQLVQGDTMIRVAVEPVPEETN